MKKIFIVTFIQMIGWQSAFSQPTGTIIAFGGAKTKIPQGWVACDGKLLDRTKPQLLPLFNLNGASWDGDGTDKGDNVAQTTNSSPDFPADQETRPKNAYVYYIIKF